MRTPVASNTALASAAPTGMIPPSPASFRPKGPGPSSASASSPCHMARYITHAWHPVLQHRIVQQHPVFPFERLDQAMAYALDDCPLFLSLHEQRVDCPPHVCDRPVALDLDLTCLRIHGDIGIGGGYLPERGRGRELVGGDLTDSNEVAASLTELLSHVVAEWLRRAGAGDDPVGDLEVLDTAAPVSAAIFRTRPLITLAARKTASPDIVVERLAPVESSYGP